MKRFKYDLEKHLALIGGLLLIAFAVVTFFAAKGHTQVLIYIMEGIGVIAIIGGFIAASFIGAICAAVAIFIVVKLMERFTMPVAVLLFIGGIALVVYWMKKNRKLRPAYNKSATSRPSPGASSAAPKSSGEERPKSIFGEFQGKEILEEFEFHGVDSKPYEEGKMKVGSEVTIKIDEEEDTFEFVCAGIVIGDIGNYTYEQMKRRALYIKLLKEGKRMVIISIQKSMYADDRCNLYVGII